MNEQRDDAAAEDIVRKPEEGFQIEDGGGNPKKEGA
jgi:hypothetical protein